ncbi:MAG: PhoH family protein [Acetobacteraceae bacterium]|jgi:phosphate starvation-inducible PhoH-like protein|nr:PhoH family protein [Acetobacteraceae bacterium]
MNHVPPVAGASADPHVTLHLTFDDNALLPLLFGEHDRHLARIEHRLGVRLSGRGNRVAVSGPARQAHAARTALEAIYGRLKRGEVVGGPDVDAAVRMATHATEREEERAEEPRLPLSDIPSIRTRKGSIGARTPAQAGYMEALAGHDLVFALGPAGTGKTYIAVAQAVAMLTTGRVERIVLSRPAVEAGERLGFLPGDMREKVDPYLRPLYDALHDMLPAEQVARRIANGEIEVAPLAFMRGRTLSHCYVILDEAQNTTPVQMKMVLTRLGEGARMVVTGDLTQVDLPTGTRSGLADALDTLEGVAGIGVVRFNEQDVVRHPLVARIVEAYGRRAVAERETRKRTRAAEKPPQQGSDGTGQ